VGKEAGSRQASLAACQRMLATLSASPEREAWLDWDDVEREMGSALRSWREEVDRAGCTAEAGPAPVEARGVDDIRARPPGQARRQEGGGERKQRQTTGLTFKNHLSTGEIYISLENEAQVKSQNKCIVTK